jgi:hypothetical protein
MGTAAAAVKESQHGGGDDDGVPVVAACALVTSLMVVWQRRRVREMKICQVIQAERWVTNYSVKYQQWFYVEPLLKVVYQ